MCLIACLFTSLNCTEKYSCSGCRISVSPPFMRQPSLSRAMKFFVLFAAVIVTSSVSNEVPGDRPSISSKDFYLTLIRRQHPNSTFLRQKGTLQWPGKPHLEWLNQSLPSSCRKGTCHQPVSPSPSTSMLINFSKSYPKNCWMTEKEIFLWLTGQFLQCIFICFAWLIKDTIICCTLQSHWLGSALLTSSLQQS